jgi:hypothetical protein
MNLKSFGCSFIFGSELSDDGSNLPLPTPSQLTWPALLAQQYGYNYQCYARPGSGNLQISEKVLNQANNIESALYVIGWTWIDRFDYVSETASNWPMTPGRPGNGWATGWKTIMPIDENELANTYYKNLHSEYRDKLTTLMAVRLTIDTLQSKNLPFIMTYIDDLMFDTTYHSSAATNELQDYIRPYMTRFDDKNFLEWSKKKGYTIGTAAHPLEQAHQAAAEYMLQLGVHKV